MTKEAEILAWTTGIGAVAGLAAGLREGENAVESTLKGAGLGFFLPIALVAMAGSTVPRVAPAQSVRPSGTPFHGPSASRLRRASTPLVQLRVSGRSVLGVEVGAGIRLSYVIAW